MVSAMKFAIKSKERKGILMMLFSNQISKLNSCRYKSLYDKILHHQKIRKFLKKVVNVDARWLRKTLVEIGLSISKAVNFDPK